MNANNPKDEYTCEKRNENVSSRNPTPSGSKRRDVKIASTHTIKVWKKEIEGKNWMSKWYMPMTCRSVERKREIYSDTICRTLIKFLIK